MEFNRDEAEQRRRKHILNDIRASQNKKKSIKLHKLLNSED